MEGCIGSTHWDACDTCKNYKPKKGCLIKTEIPLSLYLGEWVICDDYEHNKLQTTPKSAD